MVLGAVWLAARRLAGGTPAPARRPLTLSPQALTHSLPLLPAGQVPLDELGLPGGPAASPPGSSSSRSSSPGPPHDCEAAAAAAADEVASAEGGPCPPITYLPIYEDARVSLGVFCLPAGTRIPLHNHPGMTVLSRCAAR